MRNPGQGRTISHAGIRKSNWMRCRPSGLTLPVIDFLPVMAARHCLPACPPLNTSQRHARSQRSEKLRLRRYEYFCQRSQSPRCLYHCAALRRVADSYSTRRRHSSLPHHLGLRQLRVRITTRTDILVGIRSPIPRELWLEVRGPAPTLEIAINVASAIANEYARHVAFASNAWHGLLDVHLAYDSSPGCRNRIFFQNWVNDERGLPRAARLIDPHLIYRVLVAMAQLAPRDRPRVIRAVTQYSDALQYWKPGSELYALAHLYMGVEGITEVVTRSEVSKRNLRNKAELARAVMDPHKRPVLLKIADWLYRLKTEHVPPAPLDLWVRREMIFQGDRETFKTARTASNNLEHGLAQHEEVHQLAVKCVTKSASYLRGTILDLLPLSKADRDALNGEPYGSPANTRGFDRQIIGAIDSETDDVAAADQAYPYILWKVDLKEFSVAENGSYDMRVTQQLTPIMHSAARLNVTQIHFAGQGETRHEDVEVSIRDRQIATATEGVEVAIDKPSDSRWVQPVGSLTLNCNAIRDLSTYWAQRLTLEGAETLSGLSFAQTVQRIEASISRPAIPKELQVECVMAWREALELDEVRRFVTDCVTQPEGLVPVGSRLHGTAPLINDIQRITDVNGKVVELAKRLVSLLDSLSSLKVFANDQEQ